MRFKSKWKPAVLIAFAIHVVIIGIFGFLVPWIEGSADAQPSEPTVEYSAGDGTDGDGGDGSNQDEQQDEQKDEPKDEQKEETPQPTQEPVTPVPETVTSPVTATDPYNALVTKSSQNGQPSATKSTGGGKKGNGGGGGQNEAILLLQNIRNTLLAVLSSLKAILPFKPISIRTGKCLEAS